MDKIGRQIFYCVWWRALYGVCYLVVRKSSGVYWKVTFRLVVEHWVHCRECTLPASRLTGWSDWLMIDTWCKLSVTHLCASLCLLSPTHLLYSNIHLYCTPCPTNPCCQHGTSYAEAEMQAPLHSKHMATSIILFVFMEPDTYLASYCCFKNSYKIWNHNTIQNKINYKTLEYFWHLYLLLFITLH